MTVFYPQFFIEETNQIPFFQREAMTVSKVPNGHIKAYPYPLEKKVQYTYPLLSWVQNYVIPTMGNGYPSSTHTTNIIIDMIT